MKCIIVILNWNNPKDTLECLDSLTHLQSPCEIIVVDNGSTDDSREQIRKAYPLLSILENPQNLGYAAGNNRGIKEALTRGAELVLLLNNDTVVAPNLIDSLIKAAMENPQAGVFGAKIYFYEDPVTLWYAGGDVDPLTWRCFHEGCGNVDLHKEYEGIRQTGYACGCAIAVRATALQQVGLLSSEFFLLWEEIDWCWRFKRAGWQCLFVPNAKVWHKVSSSFPEGNHGPFWQYHYFRSRLIFLRRNLSFRKRILFYFGQFPWEIAELFIAAFRPHNAPNHRIKSRAALKGIVSYFIKRSWELLL